VVVRRSHCDLSCLVSGKAVADYTIKGTPLHLTCSMLAFMSAELEKNLPFQPYHRPFLAQNWVQLFVLLGLESAHFWANISE